MNMGGKVRIKNALNPWSGLRAEYGNKGHEIKRLIAFASQTDSGTAAQCSRREFVRSPIIEP